MITIVLIVVFGVLFSVFATQNTGTINLIFGNYTVTDIPIYIVILMSIGLGVLIVAIYHLLHSLSIYFLLGGQEKEIKDARKQLTELTREVHKLEIENTKLKSKLNEEDEDDDSF